MNSAIPSTSRQRPPRAVKQGKEKKTQNDRHKTGNEGAILSLFPDKTTAYAENPKRIYKTTSRINKFSKATKYKVNLQKSNVFLYSSKQMKTKILKW